MRGPQKRVMNTIRADAPRHRRGLPFRLRTTSRFAALNAPWLLFCRYYTVRAGKRQPFAHTFLQIPHALGMTLVIIRTAIVFVTLLLIMRLMGKRQIGEMQPFELVITLLIAELACIPMADTSIPLLYGVVSVLTIFVLHEIVTLIDLKIKPLKSLISGKPSVVVNKDGIDDYQLKKNRLDVSDLIESLRAAGYFSLDAIDYALYEANGTFSALPKQNYEQSQTSLPLVIIDNGKYDAKNLELAGLTRQYFDGILKEQGVKNIKKVLVLTADGEGKLYLQQKGKKFCTVRVAYPHAAAW